MGTSLLIVIFNQITYFVCLWAVDLIGLDYVAQ